MATLTALERETRQWAAEQEFDEELFSSEDAAKYNAIFTDIGQERLIRVDPELIYGRLFDKIGFGTVRTSDNEIFKSLCIIETLDFSNICVWRTR